MNEKVTLGFGYVAFSLAIAAFALRIYTLTRELLFGKDRRKKQKDKWWWQDQNLRVEISGLVNDTFVLAIGSSFALCPTCRVGDTTLLTMLAGICPTFWWIDCIIKLDVIASRTSTLADLDLKKNKELASTLRWLRYRAAPVIIVGLVWGFLSPIFVLLANTGTGEEDLAAVRCLLSGVGFLNSSACIIALILMKEFGRAIDKRLAELESMSFQDPKFKNKLLAVQRKIRNLRAVLLQNLPSGIPFFVCAAIPGLAVFLGHYFIMLLMILGIQMTFGMHYLLWVDYSTKMKSFKSAKVGALTSSFKSTNSRSIASQLSS